ncbi:MATE family efflux transporter [Spirosoma flavum]|uniref:Oligosaccharide flippase family protein n=1 Tax=Spirosoma flavum TaxID=2048557 RepID=A0ABW6AI73_9BACT
MQAANRVIKNTGILYARMAITVFMSLYATRLILNGLGITDFGIFNVVAGAISMLTFLNSAMSAATQRFMSFAEGEGDFSKLKSIFNVSIVLHIIIAILVFLVLEGVGYFLFNGILKIPESRMEVTKIIFQFMIVSTLLTIISVPYDAVISAHENMLLFAILGIIESTLKLAIALYITYTHYDKLIVYGLLTAALTITILTFKRIYCHKKYTECGININLYFNKSIFRDMARFAGWSLLGSSSSLFANYGQGIVINTFFGPEVNAAQGISSQISGQLGAFSTTLLKALNPIINKSEGGGNRNLMLKASMTGSRISFFLLIVFYVPVLIEMPYIFSLWLKNVPEYVIIFCRLLLLRNLIEQLGITLHYSITAVGNIKKYQIFVSIITFFPLVISYILFNLNFSAYALYVVFLIFSVVNFIITLYFANEKCDLSISTYMRDVVFRCFLIFTILITISFIPTLIIHNNLIRLMSVVITSTVCFIILIWTLGFSFEERLNIRKLAITIIKKFDLDKDKTQNILLKND